MFSNTLFEDILCMFSSSTFVFEKISTTESTITFFVKSGLGLNLSSIHSVFLKK